MNHLPMTPTNNIPTLNRDQRLARLREWAIISCRILIGLLVILSLAFPQAYFGYPEGGMNYEWHPYYVAGGEEPEFFLMLYLPFYFCCLIVLLPSPRKAFRVLRVISLIFMFFLTGFFFMNSALAIQDYLPAIGLLFFLGIFPTAFVLEILYSRKYGYTRKPEVNFDGLP